MPCKKLSGKLQNQLIMKKLLFLLIAIGINIYLVSAQQSLGENEAANVHFYNYKGVTMTNAWNKFLLPDGAYDYQGTDLDVLDWNYAGIHWAKVSFLPENSIESFDQHVNAAVNAGLRIIGGYKKPYNTYTYGTPEEEAKNVEYLKKLVERYKDRIKYWQIWNEVNIPEGWDFGTRAGEGTDDPNAPFNIGVHKYALFLKDSYEAIKSVDPEAIVVMAGLSSSKFIDFMDRLNVEEAYKYFDETAIHPYAKTPREVVRIFVAFQEKVSEFPAPYNNKPIWITEIGWHAQSSWASTLGAMYVETEQKKGDYLAETLPALIDTMIVKRPVLWYCMHENNSGKGFGLTQKMKEDNIFISNRLEALGSMKNIDDSQVLTDKTDIPNFDITIQGATSDIQVYVDGNLVNFPTQTPFEYGGKILLPANPVFSAMNIEVDDTNEKKITASSELSTFSFGVGKMIIKVNWDYIYLDQHIYKINNNVMLPVEMFKKAFAANVNYNQVEKKVHITTFENYQQNSAKKAPKGFSYGGSWDESSLLGANPNIKTYFSTNENAYAIWNPGIKQPSQVKVSVYKLVHSSSTTQSYCIFHNGNMDIRTVNCRDGVSGWVELGTFDFAGTGIEYLKLPYTSGYLRIAEAKFEIEGGDTIIIEQTMVPNSGDDDDETELLFSYDFEDLQDADDWEAAVGEEWEILNQAGNNVFKLPNGTGENLLLLKNVQLADGYVESDITMHTSVGGAAGGLLVRYVNQNNYYMLRLHSTQHRLQLYKKENGTFTMLKDVSVSVNLEITYQLKIKFIDDSLKCYVNGDLKMEAFDETFTTGAIGFRVYDQSVSIDNVEIHKTL